MKIILNKNGSMEYKDDDAVVADVSVNMVVDFCVRLIKDDGTRKCCIGEEYFKNNPTSGQIMWCLLKYPEADFACVSERYSLENEYPFSW